MHERIQEGATLRGIFEEFSSLAYRYHTGISKAIGIYAPRRDPERPPKIEIFWGPSGTGKTRRAVTENPDAYILSKPRGGKDSVWWQGYEGQETVIIDEFYGWIPYDFLLRCLDRYPLEVEFKGGSTQLAATHFVITSNKPWREWYPNIDNVSALERRINEYGTVTFMDIPHNE